MDLYAYSQIDKYKKYLEENNIDIPRLRGLRLMKDEEPVSEEKIKEYAEDFSKYIILAGIDSASKDKRKRYEHALKRVKKQYGIYNKYVGKNVLYVHARVGGANWDFFGMDEITKHPLYLERIDDFFDSTYCDIYFKLKEEQYEIHQN